ncbi:MAG: response regulator FixJ [Caulobacteraceae bacterium]
MAPKSLVHVIDDDDAMRDSLGFLLEMQGFDCRLYESADRFVKELPNLEPGCIITDIRMPGLSGLELVQKLKEAKVALPVIVVTGHGDVSLAVEAMKAGVVDFLEKPFPDDVLLASVNDALARITPGDSLGQQRAEALKRLENLSPRERDVLMGVVSGKANKVIALELEISARTVEVYRANLMSKTGSRNISDLMRLALAAGL